MKKANILIVDDNESILSALEILLMPEFNIIHCLSNPELVLNQLGKYEYNLVLLDMNFKAGINTGNEGIFWLQKIKEKFPEISVVMITAFGDVELAVKALKLGATDFILKPWDNAKLMATIDSAIQLSQSRNEVKELRLKEHGLKQALNQKETFIIGSSPELMKVLKLVAKVAKTDTNVLITGENGTGKELIAKEIHRLSRRSSEVMVSVDMGAISETLFESELFGHVKGSFTDAREDRTGKFEVSDKGTLFLDEIGNLSYNLQGKLLAAIQNRQITRIGSNKTIHVDIRLICATNRSLPRMVEKDQFREDLLYRINTIQIELPPLRSRGNDIIILAEFFLDKFTNKYDKPKLTLNNQAKEKLLKYQWPGNIRELEHTMEKAVILSESNVLKASDFFLNSIPKFKGEPESLKIDEMEKVLIIKALEKSPDNISAAADHLGITRQTLYNKMKRYGIG